MIQITHKNNTITIKGHSGYEEAGKDIVCASVSNIAITSVNAIIRLEPESIDIEKEDGYLKIEILKNTKVTDTLIENMMDLFYQLEQQYQKYVKIKK